jgi:hypothetical protein
METLSQFGLALKNSLDSALAPQFTRFGVGAANPLIRRGRRNAGGWFETRSICVPL